MARKEERQERLVRSTLRAGWAKFGAPELDDATSEYIGGMASAILSDARSPEEGEEELLDQLGPLLREQSLKEKQVVALVKALARCAFPPRRANAGSATLAATGAAKRSAGDAVLCHCKDLILMYLGSTRLLLKDTTFELLRGHRYGVVGSNGAGKTTLMERIAAGAIEQLARSELRFVHIRHETLDEEADPLMPALDFVRRAAGEDGDAEAALDEVGFDAKLRLRRIRELSGGWRVRLLLATAVVQCADVLLLDEPTNHLDAEAVRWLVCYVTQERPDATCLIVSHDAPFLDKVCTDIIHFDECQLKYYAGNFSSFQDQASLHDEEDVRAVLQVRDKEEDRPARTVHASKENDSAFRMFFPIPGKVEGIATSKKTVIEVKDASYRYPGKDEFVLQHVNSKITLASRVAIIGPNGAGKSTFVSLLCGETRPSPDEKSNVGEVNRHRTLRLAYIAQSQMFHLGEFAQCTVVEYIQLRFRNGYDEALQKRLTAPPSEQEASKLVALAAKYGKYGKRIEAVVSRTKRGKEWRYEVAWEGLSEKQNTFEPISRLRQLGVERLATALDERLASVQSGVDERPLTRREIIKHFEGFGLSEEMVAQRSISTFSGGQRSKLMIGAAFWTKPHIVCLDEPTNFLDFETVEALARALRTFRGGVVVVSHNEDFLASICNEIWSIRDRQMVVVRADERRFQDDAQGEGGGED